MVVKTQEKNCKILKYKFLFLYSRKSKVKTNKKIYFYVRNMVIGNFNPIELRTAYGALWENFREFVTP